MNCPSGRGKTLRGDGRSGSTDTSATLAARTSTVSRDSTNKRPLRESGGLNVRPPDVEEFTMNPCKAKTPLLGKGGVDAPSRKMLRRHLIWRGRGGSFKGTI